MKCSVVMRTACSGQLERMKNMKNIRETNAMAGGMPLNWTG